MKFKKIVIAIFLILLIVSNTQIIFAVNENNLELTASGVILIDNKTNQILYSKNENEKMYPASTTKISK